MVLWVRFGFVYLNFLQSASITAWALEKERLRIGLRNTSYHMDDLGQVT